MTIWKDLKKVDGSGNPIESLKEESPTNGEAHPFTTGRTGEPKESVIATGLTIEGKIDGEGDIRIAGNFKGDVRVKGNLIVDSGARLNAEVSADSVIVGGQVEGNINAATHVRLLESAQMIGDLKAKSLTVAAGSRMRGRVEFGWDEHETKKVELNVVKKAEVKAEHRAENRTDHRPTVV